MDLSINKINLKNSIKFKGLKGDLSKTNTRVFKFYPPAYNKSNEVAFLEFATVKYDKETGERINPRTEDFKPMEFKDGEPIELVQDKVRAKTEAFAYRYAIKDKNNASAPKYVIDDARTIELDDRSRVNFIDIGENYGVSPKAGTIRHSFVDSDAIYQTEDKIKGYDPEFVRNHFNKLGGSINGLRVLLKSGELDPYRYILSTPDIGVDEISSHKYWPNNQYQCTDVEEFKSFIFELYKKGKGYIADGAFTSQGLQSPIVQHVLKWGKKSPFYNMLKVDSALEIGVLPDRSPVEGIGNLDYIAVKMINNPHRKDYNPNKATYIQFFDTRLVTDKTRDKNEIIKQYDKEPEDHYDITNHQNSVVPYYFEVKPNDVKRVNKFIENDWLALEELEEQGTLDDFLRFPNFTIVSKAHAAGANYWDGHRDIVKMNLSNPTGETANREGFFNARNYLLGVASYWTELIQSDLILQTAKMGEAERIDTAKNNDIGDYSKLKQSLNSMHFPVLEQNKQVEDYVKTFPLQSIKTDPTLSAIFSEPEFQGEFFDKYTLKDISNIVNSALDRIIPDKYSGNKQYKTYLAKVYANKLTNNLLVGALCPLALTEKGGIDSEKLKAVSLYSLGAQNANNVEEERRIVGNKIKQAINPKVLEGTIETLSKEISKVSLDDFKEAEAMVLQGKAGLNWRFDASKDIGDLDTVRDRNASFEYVWKGDEQTPGVEDFWINFVKNIKTYNPSAYIISELTCMNVFTEMLRGEGFEDFNEKMTIIGKGEGDMLSALEGDFTNITGSTTISNYSDYFNNLSMFVGENPEEPDKVGSVDTWYAGNVEALKERADHLLFNSQPNSAMYSHAFVDNHDKPRLLHTMPLNTKLFLTGQMDNRTQLAVSDLFKRSDYENMAPTAMAVALALKEEIDKRYGDSDIAQKLTESLSNLANGKKDADSEPDYRRADAFGHLPYEITIRDMFKGANLTNKEVPNIEEEMLDFRYDFLKKYIEYETKLWEVMNAVVGSPTLFNGTEFFQTGYESASHNFYVANRNQTMHEMKDDKRFGKHFEAMQNIGSLYKEPALRAIRDGFTVSGKIIGETKNNEARKKLQIWPLYQDNGKGSKVITLITNNGVPTGLIENSDVKNQVYVLDNLVLDFGKEAIEDGTVFNRIYLDENGKYITDKTKYTVRKVGNGEEAKYILEPPAGKKIHLTGTVERFFVPTKKIQGQF